MDEPDLAIDYLQRFVSDPGADPATVQKALQHLTELRETDVEAPSPEIPVLEFEPPTLEVRPIATESTIQARRLGPNHLLIGSGIAALGTGSLLGYKALQAHNQYSDSALDLEERLAAAGSGQRLALMADLGIGTGAVLICGGTWLTLRDSSLSLSPGPAGTLVLSWSR